MTLLDYLSIAVDIGTVAINVALSNGMFANEHNKINEELGTVLNHRMRKLTTRIEQLENKIKEPNE